MPQRGVFEVTVRVIQAISSAEMMISAMPTTVSTEWLLPSPDPDRWPDLRAMMGLAQPEIKNGAGAPEVAG
jgi:hypothetical protein